MPLNRPVTNLRIVSQTVLASQKKQRRSLQRRNGPTLTRNQIGLSVFRSATDLSVFEAREQQLSGDYLVRRNDGCAAGEIEGDGVAPA